MVKLREEVERFLALFFPKLEIWGIFVLYREKNQEALRLLGITPAMRKAFIKTIEVKDYVETVESTLNCFGDMWVFGKDYDGEEMYIKVALGDPGTHTICISFHKAEYPLQYAFKDEKNG